MEKEGNKTVFMLSNSYSDFFIHYRVHQTPIDKSHNFLCYALLLIKKNIMFMSATKS